MNAPASHLQNRRIVSRATLLSAASFAALSSLHAQSTWVGDTSQDWNNAANWSSDPSAPTGNFIVNTATGNFPTLSTNSAFSPVDIFVGNGAGNSGRLDHSAGLLSSGAGNWSFVGNGTGATGTYNMSGSSSFTSGRLLVAQGGATGTMTINTSGTVTANAPGVDWWNSSGIVVGVDNGSTATLNLQAGTIATTGTNANLWVGGLGGNGTLNQTGGTINVAGTLSLARYWGTGTMSVSNATVNAGFVNLSHAGAAVDLVTGIMNLNNGATVNSEGDVTVGFAGNASSQGTLNVNAGSVLNVGTTTERWMIVNQWDTAKGVVNVDGGTINLNAGTDLRFSTGNGTGASVVNLNSGAITSWSGNQTGTTTTGELDLNRAGGASANNTFNLNGGTLTVQQVVTTSNNGTAVFNFNGGTLKASNSSTSFVALGGASQTAVVRSGGAIVDSNGFNVTISQALLDGTGGGGLTKNGLGTLTLSGVNTYTGATVVNAGTLTLASAGTIAGSTAYTIANGAEFDVSAKASYALSGVTVSFNLDASTGGFFDAGTAALDFTNGNLTLSFSTASLANGQTYNLADFGSQTGDLASIGLSGSFGGSLSRTGDVWTGVSGSWGFSFNEANGILTVTAVPEPSTFAALAGMLGLGFAASRRRRA